jgi:ribonuclease P protein component
MPSRLYSLNKKKDFEKIFKAGKSAFGASLMVKATDNEFKKNQFGIVISSKVSKKATERNKARRRLKEIARTENRKFVQGKNIIIIGRPLVIKQTYQELEASLIFCFKKLGLYDRPSR